MPFAKIIVTNSTTAGAQPNPLDLSVGELTLNVADGKLFALDTLNNVVKLSDKTFESRLSYLEGNPGVWGSINGTLTDQSDLTTALDEKVNSDELINADFNTTGIANGARITLTPNLGPDTSFDLIRDGDGLSVSSLNDVITIEHLDTTRTNSTTTSSPAFGDSIVVVTSVSSNTKGHTTAVETSTITLPDVQSIESRLDALDDITGTVLQITSFDVSPSTELYEFAGSTQYDLDFNWNTNTTPTSISLTTDFSSPALTSADTTYDEPAFPVTNNADGTEREHSWTLSVTNSSQTTSSSTKTIRWVYPFFHGTDTTDLSAGSGIEGLTKLVARKQDTTAPINATNEFIYFAYPNTYGDLSAVLDGNGLNVTSSFTKFDSVNVTPTLSNVSTAYKIYKSNATTTINQNFQFKF
jgi:hypothetical protein